MLEGLKSIYIAVSDFDSSVKFYRDLLGLSVVHFFEAEDGHRGCLLKAGDVTLVLAEPHEEYTDKSRWQAKLSLEKIEIGFKVRDLDDFYREIVRKGGSVVQGPEITHYGTRQMVLKDPDGIPVNVYQ